MERHDALTEELTLALLEIEAAFESAGPRPSWWTRLVGVFRGIVI